ncbi:MAG: GAF domain-containing protein [candidate division Zixibacteria bacterium]|nr:GAF domain-containing protein [candidate division Zixibacteria bacterium]
MSEEIFLTEAIIEDIKAIISAGYEKDEALDRIVEKLKDEIPYYDWVGFYLIQDGKLKLGPYRGKPSPHEVIEISDGICGAAVRENSTIIVDDVNADPRYLACSIETKSEIVVPITRGNRVVGEIDIDSHTPAAFTDNDKELLEKIAGLVTQIL